MLDDKQKRAFIALACKVAWADGVVAAEERAQVAMLLQRLGSPITPEELDQWLSTGSPPAELADLSPALGEMFIYEAWKLIQADGVIDDKEIRFIETLMSRVSKLHEGTPVARVALVKKPVPR